MLVGLDGKEGYAGIGNTPDEMSIDIEKLAFKNGKVDSNVEDKFVY